MQHSKRPDFKRFNLQMNKQSDIQGQAVSTIAICPSGLSNKLVYIQRQTAFLKY